jgi:fatty acid desaturase
VAVAIGLLALDFAIYAWVEHPAVLVGYWLLMIVPKGCLSAWNHHHQHAFTFHSATLNRLLELVYALHTGVTTHTWVLHHVLGHHVSYMDQTRDPSRWKTADGRTMGWLRYTLTTALTAYPRAYVISRRYPRYRREFLGYLVVTLAIVVALMWARPLQGLFVFVLPMLGTMMYTAWVTYDHHAGLDTEDPMQASYNIMSPWFNRITGNLGYHTAHHHSGGLHWSKLPALHDRLKDRIPAELYRTSTFDTFLPD